MSVRFDLPILDVNVTTRVSGLQVGGSDIARRGPAFRSNGSWQVEIDVGNITFTYPNLTIDILNDTYHGSFGFYPFAGPVLFRLEKNGTSCTVSSGPFDSSSIPMHFYKIDGDVEELSDNKHVLCALASDPDFLYEYFLQAFFSAVQDPLYLLTRQLKLCPLLDESRSNM